MWNTFVLLNCCLSLDAVAAFPWHSLISLFFLSHTVWLVSWVCFDSKNIKRKCLLSDIIFWRRTKALKKLFKLDSFLFKPTCAFLISPHPWRHTGGPVAGTGWPPGGSDVFPNCWYVPGQTSWWSEHFFYPIKLPQVAQSGTSDWVNLIFCILSGSSQLELILVSIEMWLAQPLSQSLKESGMEYIQISNHAKRKEAIERHGWSWKIKGEKEKTVKTGCRQMRHINSAFSGGGAKVNVATVSQDSEDTDPAADPVPVCRAATGQVVILGPLRTLVCDFRCIQGTQN